MALENDSVINNVIKATGTTPASIAESSVTSPSGNATVPINVDLELLKKLGISPEKFMQMSPEQQQKVLDDATDIQNDASFRITGWILEKSENHNSENEQIDKPDGEDHPQVPTKAEWRKMSYEERMQFLLSEIDYHMDKRGIPEDQREKVFKEWADKKLIEKRGISIEKWNSFSEEKKQRIRERYALSFETAIKNGYTEEDYAEMSEYTKLRNEAKVAQEKIAKGDKLTKADIIANNQGAILDALDNIDAKNSETTRTVPNFMEKYEREVQENLAGFQRLKGTKDYAKLELSAWADALVKAYKEAPEDDKASVVAGLTEEQRLKFLKIMSFHPKDSRIPYDLKVEMMQNFGLRVEDSKMLLERLKRGEVSGQEVTDFVQVVSDAHNRNIEDGASADEVNNGREAVTYFSNYNLYDNPEMQEKMFDILSASEDGQVRKANAGNIYQMAYSAQNHATEVINNNNTPEAKELADAALQGAYGHGATVSMKNIQNGFNSGKNEYTRQGTIEFTSQIKDAKLQDEFDKNNFEATEALEDKEMALRLHQHRINEMPKWDAKVQEQAFQRTMESKYTEVQDYAASNISKLDPTVQRSAMDAVYEARRTQNNDKVVTSAIEQIEKMPPVVQQEEIARVVIEEVSTSAPQEADDFIQKYNNGSLSKADIANLSSSDRRKYFDNMFKKASLADKIKILRNVSGNNAKHIFNMICRYGDVALITNMVLSEGMGARMIKSGVAPDVANKIVSILKRSSSNEAISQINELRNDKTYAKLFEDYAFGNKEKVNLQG